MSTQARDKRTGQFTSSRGNGQPVQPARPASPSHDMLELISNTITSRSQLMRQFLDPRRNINDECGYLETERLTAEVYRDLYDREPVATRVVQVLPQESWCVQPTVYETEDVDNVTIFEEAWENLGRRLQGPGWYKGEEGSPIWEHLQRADILSGIGSFGVLLLGIDDGKELKEPIEEVEQQSKPTDKKPPLTKETTHKLLYLRSFDESLVDIISYENDKTNPRYGQPTKYNIAFNDPSSQAGSADLATATQEVHWTRLIHLADNLGSSEVFGVPRMRPVYNRLMDLRKLYAGSAEMYWRGAFPGLSIETHPQLGGEVEVDVSDVRNQLEQYMNGLQRYLAFAGVSAKSLAPQVVDPTPQVNVQIEAICIRIGIPKRIFLGSERGELSSTQDEGTWNDRLQDRQNRHLTPRVIIPFVDRLIMIGVLPVPEEYTVQWPDLYALSEQEEAQVAVTKTEAMAKYIGGSVESLMVPMDYLTRVLGMKHKEAEEVLKAAQEEQEEREVEQEAEQAEQLKQAQAAGVQPGQPPGVPPKASPGSPFPGQPKDKKEAGEEEE